MNPQSGREKSLSESGGLAETEPLSAGDETDRPPGALRVWLGKILRGKPFRLEERRVERALRRVLPPSDKRLTDAAPIGEGGMATVESVFDRAVRRKAARKVLLSNRETQLAAVQAFVNEAQITGQLDHPNIVPVYDFGRNEDGRLFFTMKLLTGRTLADVVRELPAGPPARATLFDLLEIGLKICDALAFAHQKGVVHGDVKPENVMVDRFGQVYLVDWGAAVSSTQSRAPERRDEPVSTSFEQDASNVIGTLAYLSPEQAVGKSLDERTDVFALGALLYYVLAREPPYRDCTVKEALEFARKAEFPPLRESASASALPRELVRIVGRAMARNPEDRYQKITELKSDLVAFVRGGTLPRVRFKSGEHIVREGDTGDRAYFIVSGSCEVRKQTDGSQERIRVLEAGECFGETAILATSPRTASVVALEDSVLEYISGEELLEEVDAMKPWMGSLLRSLAEWFRERETAGGS